MQRQTPEVLSIQEKLLHQLQLLALNDTQYLIAQHIIGSLTDRGYLPCSPRMIAIEIETIYYTKVTEEQIAHIITQIQQIGPVGIAARNLQECLLLQLGRKEPTETTQRAIELITNHFDHFAKKHYEKLTQKMKITLGDLREVLAETIQLRPYPIVPVPTEASKVILEPDFLVTCQQGHLSVNLIERKMPRITIQKQYQELLYTHKKKASQESKEIVTFVQDKINRAKWFVQAIEQRKKTLLKTMKAIVDLQRPFFTTGKETTLKPIFLRHVAEKIKMDVSTVSRAISHKAVATNGQVYSLKYFFSEPIQTKDGKEVSSRIVKKIIVDQIAQEDKTAPYTDEEITALLQKAGYLLARRTVAKYRQQANLPIARLRKELV